MWINMLRIVLTDDYSDNEFLQDVINLDKLVYPLDFQGDFESINARFERNKNSFILLYDDDILIGYMCIFPIKEFLYHSILEGRVKEDGFLDDDYVLPYITGEEHNLYIISMVIHPKYQSVFNIKVLLQGLYSYLRNLASNNYRIRNICAISLRDKGKFTLDKLNFERKAHVKDGIYAYNIDYMTLMNKIFVRDKNIKREVENR